MTTLYLDLETYCEVPITNGTHAYAAAAEIMLWAWAVDDGPVKVDEFADGKLTTLMANPGVEVVLHSKDDFDRVVLKYQGIEIAHERIWNTAVQALSHGLPAGLDKLCGIMGVSEELAKDKRGKALIQLFCKPRPKTSKIRRATKHTHPIEWERFKQYAGSDVLAMRELKRRLPAVNYPGSERERALYCLDLRMNDRGMMIDQALARGAIDTVAKAKKGLDARTQEMTDDQLRSTTQRDELLKIALKEYGVTLPDMQAGTIERRLEDPDLPEGLRELLRIRLQVSTTSNAKYNRLLKAVSDDGRLRGSMQFSGAMRTKRWSGRIFQPQNLLRPDLPAEEIELAIAAITDGYANLLWDDLHRLCANAVRGVIVAEPGCKLVISDLAQVEARVLPWLADEEWKLEAFRAYDRGEAPDNYIMAYARGFGVDPELVDKFMRQIGKVSELSCGYGGAYAAWASMGLLYGFQLPRDEVLAIVRAWREAHPAICDWDTGLWKQLDDAARQAIANPGKTFTAGRHIRFERWRNWMRMQLPSGGFLNYANPAIVEDPRRPGRDTVSYMGVNNYTKKWERIHTYGGKLSADATQATAREIMAENLPAIEALGYAPILLVHDEVVTEVLDTEDHTATSLNALLAAVPSWAEGLPLAAGGFETHRYRKE